MPQIQIDLERWLTPVAAESPAGPSLELDPRYVEMETAGRGEPARQQGGAMIPATPPNWQVVGQRARELLGQTRDLTVALRLATAALHVDGLAGFRDGLKLIHGLLTEMWDHVHPQPFDDDQDDPDRWMQRYSTLMQMNIERAPAPVLEGLWAQPLVTSRLASRTLGDLLFYLKYAGAPHAPSDPSETPAPKPDEIRAFLRATPVDALRAAFAEVDGTLEALRGVCAAYNARLRGGQMTLTMPHLETTLGSARRALQEVLGDAAPAAAATTTDTDAPEPDDAPTTEDAVTRDEPARSGPFRSREDIAATIDRMCAYFERYEPTSPVPFFLRRARALMEQDFLQLIQELAPGGLDQARHITGAEPAAE
ncbi:MAG: type VI secretion system protein TssA [Planctomycetes bacterium]|nr:type VI secretion system protein TssA [Planctomycetota bacterium]